MYIFQISWQGLEVSTRPVRGQGPEFGAEELWELMGESKMLWGESDWGSHGSPAVVRAQEPGNSSMSVITAWSRLYCSPLHSPAPALLISPAKPVTYKHLRDWRSSNGHTGVSGTEWGRQREVMWNSKQWMTRRHHLPGNPQKPHIGAELPVLVGPKLFYLGIKKILWVYLCNPRNVLIAFFFPPSRIRSLSHLIFQSSCGYKMDHTLESRKTLN